MESETTTILESILKNVFHLEFASAIPGVVLLIPHLFVLTRTPMRTSSTNSLLIAIAFCELITLLEILYERVQGYWITPYGDPCVNEENYWYQVSIVVGDALRPSSRICSYWLGVFLALIRLLIMKIPGGSDRLSETSFGYVLSFLICFGYFSLTGYVNFEWNLVQRVQVWRPDKSCAGFPPNYSEPRFNQVLASAYAIEMYAAYRIASGLSLVLLSALHPLLAILLALEVQRTSRKVTVLSSKLVAERKRTEKMILIMTVAYVVASAPGGALEIVPSIISVSSFSNGEILVGYGSIFTSVLFCLNASFHVIINFVMSSKYRATVKIVFGMAQPVKSDARKSYY